MSKIFSYKTIKSNWSLIPVLGFTAFACVMGSTYIFYMMKTKPDVNFRFGDNERLPEMDVSPKEIRKLVVQKKEFHVDPEIEKLKQELHSYKY